MASSTSRNSRLASRIVALSPAQVDFKQPSFDVEPNCELRAGRRLSRYPIGVIEGDRGCQCLAQVTTKAPGLADHITEDLRVSESLIARGQSTRTVPSHRGLCCIVCHVVSTPHPRNDLLSHGIGKIGVGTRSLSRLSPGLKTSTATVEGIFRAEISLSRVVGSLMIELKYSSRSMSMSK